jgi:hypothetical protein
MFGATNYPITVVELPQFEKQAERIFSGDELSLFIDFVAQTPDMGDVIQGSGGIRKLRWGARSQGKRGGARVIYYFRDLNMPVFLIAMYLKGEKITLTQGELKEMRALVDEIVGDYHAIRHVLRVHQRPA